MSQTLRERFEALYIPEPNSGCWLWLQAPTGLLGHGQMRINGRQRMATHIALELAGRPLPPGMFACHHCDTPSCVNPDHLFVGTQQDNVTDALSKGRHDLRGLRLGPAHNKSPVEVKEKAKALYQQGLTITTIARAVNRSIPTIFQWFVEWGHIPKKGRYHGPA